MNALSILLFIGYYGGRIREEDGQLKVELAPQYITPELREAVAANKAELLALVSAGQTVGGAS